MVLMETFFYRLKSFFIKRFWNKIGSKFRSIDVQNWCLFWKQNGFRLIFLFFFFYWKFKRESEEISEWRLFFLFLGNSQPALPDKMLPRSNFLVNCLTTIYKLFFFTLRPNAFKQYVLGVIDIGGGVDSRCPRWG